MWRTDLGAALSLLTRVPVRLAAAPDLSRAVWAFPLVGAAVGVCGALVLAAGRAAGLPPVLAALWTLAALALLTGALHEDGLADVADGFGGGRSPARKLEIMRDSRVGSYGALALVLATGVRMAALASLAAPGPALVAAAALSRAAMGVPLLLLPPARPDGMGARAAGRGWPAWAGFALAIGIAVAALPGGRAVAAASAALVAALALTGLARAQLGGFTGDVLGACAALSECAALSALAT